MDMLSMAYVGESVCSYEPSDDEGSDGLSLPREPSDGQMQQESAKIRDRKTSALVRDFAMTEKVPESHTTIWSQMGG